MLTLRVPIPPATVSFAATATLLPANSPEAQPVLEQPKKLLPPGRYDSANIVEIVPRGHFVTYGIGVPLMQMRDPARTRARVPVA